MSPPPKISPASAASSEETGAGPEICVLYFAALRDLVGQAEEHISVPLESPLLGDVLRLLETRHPRLRLDAVRVALNEEFADASASVSHGDVVALIPPVSGG